MTQYREILRLHSQEISQRNIAVSCACSRNTVSKIIQRAEELGIAWPLEKDLTDGELRQRLFADVERQLTRKHPDYEYIHREMAKSGVTLSLLWNEYCENCRSSREIPLMYSQLCHHYQQFTLKSNATMRIQRKPGEQLEVDWAGQAASIIDRETGEIVTMYVFCRSPRLQSVCLCGSPCFSRSGELDYRPYPYLSILRRVHPSTHTGQPEDWRGQGIGALSRDQQDLSRDGRASDNQSDNQQR